MGKERHVPITIQREAPWRVACCGHRFTHPTASLQQEGTVQCTYNAPASALHFSALPGTHRHTHSFPRRTEGHCELLTSVDGVCPGSFCSPQHLTSSDRTAWYFLCGSAARAAVSCLTVLLRGPSCCALR